MTTLLLHHQNSITFFPFNFGPPPIKFLTTPVFTLTDIIYFTVVMLWAVARQTWNGFENNKILNIFG